MFEKVKATRNRLRENETSSLTCYSIKQELNTRQKKKKSNTGLLRGWLRQNTLKGQRNQLYDFFDTKTQNKNGQEQIANEENSLKLSRSAVSYIDSKIGT